MQICIIEGCEKSRRRHGLCGTHNWRKEHGIPMDAPLRRRTNLPCLVASCDNPGGVDGYCTFHHVRLQRGVELNKPKRRDNNPGNWSDWYPNKDGYIVRHGSFNGKSVSQLQHRFVMQEFVGRKLLRNETVHHKNGNRADNSLSNLELWSVQQPAGQRVQDKLEWAYEIIKLYGSTTWSD